MARVSIVSTISTVCRCGCARVRTLWPLHPPLQTADCRPPILQCQAWQVFISSWLVLRTAPLSICLLSMSKTTQQSIYCQMEWVWCMEDSWAGRFNIKTKIMPFYFVHYPQTNEANSNEYCIGMTMIWCQCLQQMQRTTFRHIIKISINIFEQGGHRHQYDVWNLWAISAAWPVP